MFNFGPFLAFMFWGLLGAGCAAGIGIGWFIWG